MLCIEKNTLTKVATFSYHNAATDIPKLPTATSVSTDPSLKWVGKVAESSKAICDDKIEVYSLTAENEWVKIVGGD